MNKKTIAIIGVLTVVLGVFCPLFTVPIIGSISYAGQMQGEGLLLEACAIASLIFALNNVHAPSFITGLIVLGDIGLSLTNFFSKIGAMAAEDNVFSRAAAKMVSPSFGFAVLLIGAALLITSVFLKDEKEPVWDKTQIYGGSTPLPVSIEDAQARDEQFKKALAGVSLKPIEQPQKLDLGGHAIRPKKGK